MRDCKHLFHRLTRFLIDGFLLGGRRRRFADKLIIETTNICSLRCSCCPNGHDVTRRPTGKMSRETFDRIMANLDVPVKACYLHMCGEPLLNPDLDYFCGRLLDRKIQPVIFSNGYMIDLELLERIIKRPGVKISFSMEITDPGVYEKLRRPASFAKAQTHLEAIDSLMARYRRVFGLNIILAPGSGSDSVSDICTTLFSRYRQLGRITFSSQWPWPRLSRTGDLAGYLSERASLCQQARQLPAVLWDGRVSFCNLDYAGEMIAGDMTRSAMSDIVNNRESRLFRRRLMTGYFPKGTLCAACLLPRYRSFTLDITRGKFQKAARENDLGILSAVDKYFTVAGD